MKTRKLKSIRSLCLASVIGTISFSVLATEIKLPGVSISDKGVQVGDIKIDDDGINMNAPTGNPAANEAGVTGGSSNQAKLANGDYANHNFSGNNLVGATLVNSDFENANFNGANLRNATLKNSDFSGASFVGACLYGAKFISSDFENADMRNAVLTATTNKFSDFDGVNLDGADRDASCGK